MMTTTPVPTHCPATVRRATSRVACPVSYDISPAAICLANTLDYFVSFLRELSDCGDAYPEFTFNAACRNHADAVIMLPGGPWVVPMPFDCVEPEGAVTR